MLQENSKNVYLWNKTKNCKQRCKQYWILVTYKMTSKIRDVLWCSGAGCMCLVLSRAFYTRLQSKYRLLREHNAAESNWHVAETPLIVPHICACCNHRCYTCGGRSSNLLGYNISIFHGARNSWRLTTNLPTAVCLVKNCFHDRLITKWWAPKKRATSILIVLLQYVSQHASAQNLSFIF